MFARWWSFCNIPLIIVISLTVFIFQVYGHWGGDYDAFVLLSPSQLRELEGVQRSKSNHHPLFLFLFGSYSAYCSTTNLHSQRYKRKYGRYIEIRGIIGHVHGQPSSSTVVLCRSLFWRTVKPCWLIMKNAAGVTILYQIEPKCFYPPFLVLFFTGKLPVKAG